MEPTASRLIRRPIHKEYQIVTTGLHEYLELERRFNEYELSWMSRLPRTYQPNIVHEFFTNYVSLLKKDCPKGAKINDMGNQDVVSVSGVSIYILECTLNVFLFGPEYEIPAATPDLEHRMVIENQQRPWLAQVLIDEENIVWLYNPLEWIAKTSLRFREKFWWVIVTLRLMPIGGNANL